MKGLIFSEPMVKAWLEGRKTVTRRLMNPQPFEFEFVDAIPGFTPQHNPVVQVGRSRGAFVSEYEWKKVECGEVSEEVNSFSPYRPGETVYIKETWADLRGMGFGNDPRTKDKLFLAAYKADTRPGSDGDRARKDYGVKWKSPRFMPEWAARSHALIKSVRPPERVREITPEEIKKEGLIVQDFAGINVLALLGLTPETYMESVAMQEFQSLWNSLYGKWKGVYRRVGGKRTLVSYKCYPFDKLDIPPIPARARKSNLPCTAYPNPWVWPIELEKQ